MNLTIPELVKHYGSKDKPEFHLPFNFRLIFSEWDADNVRDLVAEFENEIPDHGWPNWVLSNHDQPRFSTRAGNEQARNGLLFLLTVRGTPTVYYGEEIGMENVEIPPDKIQDPWEILSPNMGLGRDPERTPMRWDSSETAGFCKKSIEPWLPVGNRSKTNNVAAQTVDPESTLNFVRQLIQLRRDRKALTVGRCRPLKSKSPVLAYLRFIQSNESIFLSLLNLSHDTETVDVSELLMESGFSKSEAIDQFELTLLIATFMDDMTDIDQETAQVRLRANEGVLLEMKKNQ
jgi:alpha-glucosidase